MNLFKKIRGRFQGFTFTILRFPLTIIFLIAAAITNINAIHSQDDTYYSRIIVTFLMGASIYAVFQLVYERFYQKTNIRMIFMGFTVLLTGLYYLLIRNTDWGVEVTIRTTVLLFILLIAFLWVPVIKSKYHFNHSFMAGFKSFFNAGFFTGVLFLGTIIILQAINILIFTVHEKAYIHSANVIFVLLAPIYFLSLIPVYPGKKELAVKGDDVVNVHDSEINTIEENTIENNIQNNQEAIKKYTQPTKFLETLLTYVIIPIAVIFTIILLLYILMNITDDFWTDNLMEPLLVSYSIIVIVVYILSASLNNILATYFRNIFPKILVPVVLFQTLSSVIKISDIGITYGRYYVILFGVFATIAGIIFSILPTRKNGLIAPILIMLSIISIIPPVDAFTVSKLNQTERLKYVLEQNQMLENNTIKPNSKISEVDKNKIVTSLRYLDQMDYSKEITWLSKYRDITDFEKVFGFSEFEQVDKDKINVYLVRDTTNPITVSDYDYFLRASIYYENKEIELSTFQKEDETYTLRLIGESDNNQKLIIVDKDGQRLISFDITDMYDYFINNKPIETTLSTQELTFTNENDEVLLTLVAESVTINQWSDGIYQSSDVNILIKIK